MALVHYIVSHLRRWRKGSSCLKSDKAKFGQEGEKIAARYLRRHGFRILYRNFRTPAGGEIDIVCRDCRKECLVFVEVKRRRSHQFGAPSLSVQTPKQHLLIRGACAWLQLLNHPTVCCRFDVVELIGKEGTEPEIHHIQDAFPVPPNIHNF